MTRKVSISRRWLEPTPLGKDGKPIPKSQWPRKRRHKWVVRWFGPDGKRYQITAETKTEAERIQAEKQAEFDKLPTARTSPRKVTVGELADCIQRDGIGPRGQHLSDATLMVYRATMDKVIGFIGADTKLADITRADAARFVVALNKQGLAKASVNKAKLTIKAAFNIAIELHGYIRDNPFRKLKQDKLGRRPIRYVTPAEFQSLMAAAGALDEDHRADWAGRLVACYPHERKRFRLQIAGVDRRRLWWQAFIALCYTAGVRKNEATTLTWGDVDFEADAVCIIAKRAIGDVLEWQPKDKDSRTIPIPGLTVDLLAQLQASGDEGNPYVLIPTTRLKQIRAARQAGRWRDTSNIVNNLQRTWKALCTAAGIEHATIHDLRRSAITNWARKLSMGVTQELAGHANIATTKEFYLAITGDDMAKARAATADAIRGVVLGKLTQN